MSGNSESEEYRAHAAKYLSQISKSYVINERSRLYEPKTEDNEQTIDDDRTGKDEATPLFISAQAGLIEKWAVAISGIGLLISTLTLVGLSLTVYFAQRQWIEMRNATEESTAATAIAAQSLYFSTIQSIVVAAGEKTSEKSLQATIDNFHQEQRAWVFNSSFLLLNEFDDAHPTFKIRIAYINNGKTPAYGVRFSARRCYP